MIEAFTSTIDRRGAAFSPAALLWLLRIGRIARPEPRWSLPVGICLFILSQIALLLALLLPWTLLATLSLGHNPARIGTIIGQLGQGEVVALLVALIPGCFGAHLAADLAQEKLVRHVSATRNGPR